MNHQLKHFDSDGQARYITFCTHHQLPMLTDAKINQIIISSIKSNRIKYNFKLLAYVIMPEHVHLIIVPDFKSKVGTIIGEIKRESSKAIHIYLKSKNSKLLDNLNVIRNRLPRFAFWQKRCYDYNCREVKDVWQKVNYCHNNPVKRGLVSDPVRYQWSSAKYYDGQSDKVLEIDEMP